MEVTRVKKSAISLQSLASLSSLGKLDQVQQIAPLSLKEHPIAYIAIELMLNFQGPFLVNDASKTKPKDAEEGDERPNFARTSGIPTGPSGCRLRRSEGAAPAKGRVLASVPRRECNGGHR